MRKSKLIGKEINGLLALDSRHIGNDTKIYVRCMKCGENAWVFRRSFLNGTKCVNCSGGRKYHNADDAQGTPLHNRYSSILRRIKGHKDYKGITMCEEWVNDFHAFEKWAIENGYKEGLTIDRIDNSKGYSPDNCRWATPKQQANNRRSNTTVEYDGNVYTLSQFADYIGLSRTTVTQRHRLGWSAEDIAKTPYRSRKKWSEQ